jgi:hypothetical protein
MQPSSASSGPERGSALRRWGPIAGIAVVVAVVAAVVIAGGGDNKSDTSTGTTQGSGQAPQGAVSFTEAKEKGLDVTFPKTCDLDTGKVAIPTAFPQDCYANAKDNGGATAAGVTKDEVTVVVYIPSDDDPILKFIEGPIKADDTGAQVEQTYQGFTDLYNAYYQTYGRKVKLVFLHGSGFSNDSVNARADAVKATQQLHAFAVWGGPVLSPAWTDEIKAHNVVCLGCPGASEDSPSAFPITASNGQTQQQLAEYVVKKLAGKPAVHAGDAFKSTTRILGQLYLTTQGGGEEKDAADFKALLAKSNVDIAQQVGYELDPGKLQEEATTDIAKLKAAGVTTVIFNGDPIAPSIFTREATNQDYFPEWIYGGSALVDTTAFGRTFDQQQWSHAFGISSLPARTGPELGESVGLYKWFNGKEPPADDTVGVLYPQPSLFFAALQAAGPDLTLDSFRAGLFAGGVPAQRGITTPTITYGRHGIWGNTDDYNGIDDFTEIWWDPAATGVDELRKQGTGMVRYVDGGKRYLPGEWTGDDKAFVEAGSITVYDTLPPGESPKDYPSPAN